MPALELTSGQLDCFVRRALRRRAGHEDRAGRAEAVEALADLAGGHHDCEVVTELLVPLASVAPLDELDSPLPEELEPVLSLACEEVVELVAAALAVPVLAAALFAVSAVLVLFDFAESAGSCPEASWT